MPTAKKRTSYKSRDHLGATVMMVPLAHDLGPARLDPEDFNRLMEDGWSSQWFLNENSVRVRDNAVRGSLANVARLITQARPGWIVRYANGRRLDLRRSNLYLVRGPWNTDYMNEACSFPMGRLADRVDASSRAAARLIMTPPRRIGGCPEVIE